MKTNKGFIGIGLAIAIIAVLAVAGGGYAVWKGKSAEKAHVNVEQSASTNTEVKTEGTVPASNGKKVAFSAFIKQDGSYECTVHQWVGNTDTIGKVYLDNGRIRANFNTDYNGSTISGSAIIKNGFAYTWSSLLPMGFKIAVKENADGVLGGSVTASGDKKTYDWNADQIGDYDCVPWTLDEAHFTVPASVQFTESHSSSM
jgi:hypothetical protein